MEVSQLKSNLKAINEGRLIKDIPGLGDLELITRGTNNPDYKRKMQAMIRALPPSARPMGIVNPKDMERIQGTCLAECALLG